MTSIDTYNIESSINDIMSLPISNKSYINRDRFIPSRSINRDLQYSNLCNNIDENINVSNLPSVNMIKSSIFDTNEIDTKILSYKDKPKPADSNHLNKMRVLFSQAKPAIIKKVSRSITCTAERVLDAPDISEDFYVNLLDWSAQNILAVALGQSVYLWNASTGTIDLLTELSDPSDSICSVSWSTDGHYLSIGTNNNNIELWNPTQKKLLRNLGGHTGRVSALAWNNFTLSSGSRDSMIFNSDVRIAQHQVATLKGHSLEVCGLKWNEDGTELASGGNDNMVMVWDAAASTPKHQFAHSAAVKALAWCPFQKNLLATGAGTADRHIRLFNSQTGALLHQVDTESQVSGLMWSKTEKELVSSHGFSQNQLTVWRYSNGLSKIADLTGHTGRILHLSMSPDASTVCSAATDETIRFWKIWDAPTKRVEVAKTNPRMGAAMLR